MVRIPVQEQTVGYSPTPLPMTSGEGYAAPGRAMQGMGQALQGVGEGLVSITNQEDDFNDKLKMLQFSNKVDLEDLKHREQFQGDPTGYTAQRADYFKQNEQELYGGLSQKGQKKAALFVEQKRGSFLEGAQKFESHKRGELMVTNTDAAISSEVGKLNVLASSLKPEEFGGAMSDTITGINAIIESAPIDETKKNRLRDIAATQVKAALEAHYGRHPTEANSRELAGKMLEMWQSKAQQVGPQSSAPQQGGGLFPVKGVDPASVPRDGGAANSREHMGPRNGGNHAGWDIPGNVGAEVQATGVGKVIKVGEGQGYGSFIDVQYDDGTIHRMAHLGNRDKGGTQGGVAQGVAEGQTVQPGQTLGYLGYSGNAGREFPHVHYEVFPDQGAYGKAQGMSSRASANLRVNPREYFAGKAGGGAVQDAGTPTGGIQAKLSAYSPQAGGDKMEGGYAASKPGPDGKAEVRTLEDVAAGRSQYVTVAGNPSLAGKSYTIPEISFVGTDGKTQTLKNVKAVVHDTGSAFKSAPEGRFDVPIAKDADNALMAKNAGLWSKAGVQFVPEGKTAQPPPVSQRGLTQVAGLKIPGVANDASPEGSPQGKGSVANPPAPFNPEALKTSAMTAFKAATGKDLPQAQQVAHPGGTTGGLSKGQGVTVDMTGMTPEEKTAAVKALGDAGYKGFHIAPMSNGDEHVTAYPSDTFKYTGAGAKDGKASGPAWAMETFAALRNQPSKGTQVAETGRPASTIPLKPSVYSSLTELFNKSMPAFAERDRAVANTIVDRFDKNAKEGIPIPPEELAAAQKAVQSVGDPVLAQKLAKTVLQTQVTAQFQQMRPDQLQAVIGDATSRMKVNGASPEQIAQIDALQKLHGTVNAALDKDMLSWGVKTAQIPALTPINPKVPESMTSDALTMRAQQARHLAQVYGREPQFFTPDEKELLLEHYKQGGPPLIKTLQGMADAFGRDTPLAMKAFGKDAPEAATLGVLIANGANPQVIKDIAYGLHLRVADPKFKEPEDKAGVYDQQRASLNGAFVLNPLAEKSATQVANLAYMVRMHAKNKDPKTFDSDEYKTALNQVLGENEANGNKYGGLYQQGGMLSFSSQYSHPVLVPANIKQDALPKLVDALRVEDLAPNAQIIAPGSKLAPKMSESETKAVETAASTAAMTGIANPQPNAATITKGMPIDDKGRPLSLKVLRAATLVSVGDGKYMMATGDPKGDEPLWVNEAGKGGDRRFILDLHKLEPVLKQRVPEAYRQD